MGIVIDSGLFEKVDIRFSWNHWSGVESCAEQLFIFIQQDDLWMLQLPLHLTLPRSRTARSSQQYLCAGLLVLLFTYTTALVLVMSRRCWTGIFGAALSPMFMASPGKELLLLQNASAGCLGLQGSHLHSGFSKPDVVARMCLRFARCCVFHSCVSAVEM